jgi:hypothetical protein
MRVSPVDVGLRESEQRRLSESETLTLSLLSYWNERKRNLSESVDEIQNGLSHCFEMSGTWILTLRSEPLVSGNGNGDAGIFEEGSENDFCFWIWT